MPSTTWSAVPGASWVRICSSCTGSERRNRLGWANLFRPSRLHANRCKTSGMTTAVPSDPQEWLADARAAAVLLDGGRAPHADRDLARACRTGRRLWPSVRLKCENLQRAGSFKIRGAYVRIARLTDDERARGVVAASAGNHAQGVALASSLLGAKSTVFMPEGAPLPKVEATRKYGADVRFFGHTLDEALAEAISFAATTGAMLIHPFDHPDIVAGQATVGLEILEQCPDARTIVVSTGGGGLTAGLAVVVKALRPDIRVVAVQAQGAAAFPGFARSRDANQAREHVDDR